MIGIYHYSDLSVRLNEIEIASGSETRSINDAYTLNLSLLPRTLKRKNVEITPFTVFENDGIFYRQKLFGASDNETGLVKIDAVDLLFADLIECDVAEFNYTATATEMLAALFHDTRFTVGECEDLDSRTIEMKNTNKLAVLNKIIELFDGEIYRNGLTVGIKNRLDYFINGEPIRSPPTARKPFTESFVRGKVTERLALPTITAGCGRAAAITAQTLLWTCFPRQITAYFTRLTNRVPTLPPRKTGEVICGSETGTLSRFSSR